MPAFGTRTSARRGVPAGGRRRLRALERLGIRRPRLPRLAAGVPAAALPRRRAAARRRLPHVYAERIDGSARRGRAGRGDLARVHRRARGRRLLEPAVRSGAVHRLHRRIRHQLGSAVPRIGGDARHPDLHMGRDLRRPRGRAIPSRCARGRRDHAPRAAGGRAASARRPGARRADLRDVGSHPRPHAHARRPAVRPVHDQAADAVLPVLARGAAVRPHRVPRGGAHHAKPGP